MTIQKRNEQRREKRQQRLSNRRSSIVAGQTTNLEHEESPFTASSFISRLTRPSRKRIRKGAHSSNRNPESVDVRPTKRDEESKVAEESETEEPDTEEDFHESQRHSPYRLPSPYSLPGAFRISRSHDDNRQADVMALDEVSIDSYSTAKTPLASLVVHGTLHNVNDAAALPIAFPETNVLLVTKRHLFICVALSCIAFGGLFTGFLFALWDPSAKENTADSSFFHNGASTTQHPTLSPNPMPDFDVDEGNDREMSPTMAPTLSPTRVMQTASPSSSFTDQPTSQTVVSTPSPTRSPTNFSSQSPVRPTTMPTLEPNPSSPSPSLPTGSGFSLTSQPAASPAMTASARMSSSEIP